VALEVIRYGQRRQAEVTLGSFQAPRAAAEAPQAAESGPADRLGFRAAPMDDATAARLRLSGGGGVVVTEVDPYGRAAGRLGRGFRIDRVNGAEVRVADDLERAAARVHPGEVVSVLGRLPDGRQTIVNYRARG
jgi:hypothetical protein